MLVGGERYLAKRCCGGPLVEPSCKEDGGRSNRWGFVRQARDGDRWCNNGMQIADLGDAEQKVALTVRESPVDDARLDMACDPVHLQHLEHLVIPRPCPRSRADRVDKGVHLLFGPGEGPTPFDQSRLRERVLDHPGVDCAERGLK